MFSIFYKDKLEGGVLLFEVNEEIFVFFNKFFVRKGILIVIFILFNELIIL